MNSRAFLASICLLVLLFTGCRPQVMTSEPAALITTVPAQTQKLSPTPPLSKQVTLPPSQVPIRQTIALTPTPSIEPCSPLEGTSLAELPQIISDPYHPPPIGKDARHQGVDFSYYRRGDRISIEGVNIQAVLAGTVAAAIPDTFPFGNMVIIETPAEALPDTLRHSLGIGEAESLYTLYAHMQSQPVFQSGQAVTRCQVLGQVGKTGNAGVAHLHLEMRHGAPGVRFPVMSYYKAGDTKEEQSNYLRWATSGALLHFDPMKLLLGDF